MLPFRLIGIANYLSPLASEKDMEKMRGVSGDCLLNAGAHAAAQLSLLTIEGFQWKIVKERERMIEYQKLQAPPGTRESADLCGRSGGQVGPFRAGKEDPQQRGSHVPH
ncbi:hypothetical protein K7X08_016905 [Anisodus acutangulus]|uniref:Uncharacterized protein n=1 Tax=Anisodus acutangulus TaxID=402998 RepID=A0A9Q1LRE7_9SOLA|nr:hypothetical protein K7X08_016905 [Anisodus acutangulus]